MGKHFAIFGILFSTIVLETSAWKDYFAKDAEPVYLKYRLSKELKGVMAGTVNEKFCKKEVQGKLREICETCLYHSFYYTKGIYYDKSREDKIVKCEKRNVLITKLRGEVEKHVQKIFDIKLIKQSMLPCPYRDQDPPHDKKFLYFSNGPNTNKTILSCFGYLPFTTSYFQQMPEELKHFNNIKDQNKYNSYVIQSLLRIQVKDNDYIFGKNAFIKKTIGQQIDKFISTGESSLSKFRKSLLKKKKQKY